MQTINITRMDEKAEEIADSLQAVGMSRISALSLAVIHSRGFAQTRDIERLSGLRQPEVSNGIRGLMERGWVGEEEEPNKAHQRGRPKKIYTLNVGFNELITDLETEKKEQNLKVVNKINILKRIATQAAAKNSKLWQTTPARKMRVSR